MLSTFNMISNTSSTSGMSDQYTDSYRKELKHLPNVETRNDWQSGHSDLGFPVKAWQFFEFKCTV